MKRLAIEMIDRRPMDRVANNAMILMSSSECDKTGRFARGGFSNGGSLAISHRYRSSNGRSFSAQETLPQFIAIERPRGCPPTETAENSTQRADR